MDDIFSKKAWCNPVATRSSTGLSTNADCSATEADSECISNGDLLNLFYNSSAVHKITWYTFCCFVSL